MSGDALSENDRQLLAGVQYRKSVRMALFMGALAVISVLSHFVPILGAETGIFPWWMTVLTVLLFVFTIIVAHGAKTRCDEAAREAG